MVQRSLALAGLVSTAAGHGAVTIPKPRNAIDGSVHPWNSTVPSVDKMPFMFWCAHPDSESSDPRKLTGSNGQACFFFNNGCDISCDECDGQTGQVVHPEFKWMGGGERPPWTTKEPWGHGWVPTNVNGTGKRPDGSNRLSICKEPKRKATLCDPLYRTMNIDAPCHSDSDFTQYAPWRAPGASPMIDSWYVAAHPRAPAPAGDVVRARCHSPLTSGCLPQWRRRRCVRLAACGGRRWRLSGDRARQARRSRLGTAQDAHRHHVEGWLCGRGRMDAQGVAWRRLPVPSVPSGT
jgi:hypothetical protein